MFHVTILSDLRLSPLKDELIRRGCVVNEIHYSAFPGSLHLAVGMVSDIVICFPFPDHHSRSGYLSLSKSRDILQQLRELPDNVCMADGRKWKAIPFLRLADEHELNGVMLDAYDVSGDIQSYYDDAAAFRFINNAVDQYKKNVVGGFDNLGFLVAEKNGRLQLGPALGGKKNLENEYYNGNADTTRSNRSGLVTVNRDLGGIQYEVEQLEFLINGKKTKEADLQKFFEENPHFLASYRQAVALPHPRFPLNDTDSLVPDFLMKPTVGYQRDSRWEVLDLKLPNVKLLSGKGNRVQFAHGVTTAISQLRDYADFFRNPNNKEVIQQVINHHLRFPKLAVLIGRMPADENVDALELAQSRDPDVRIITYDEILDSQRNLLN